MQNDGKKRSIFSLRHRKLLDLIRTSRSALGSSTFGVVKVRYAATFSYNDFSSLPLPWYNVTLYFESDLL